jgi:hypothetical protein
MLEILPNRSGDYPKLDPVEAQRIVRAFLTLKEPARSKVRLALQRLNFAQRRRSIGDRALELSIGFETLLLTRSEQRKTKNLVTRTVNLLGGGKEVRKSNADTIRETYDIRSELVHAGRIATGSRLVNGIPTNVSDIVERATVMCSELIAIIIRRGSIPKP